MSLTRRDLLLLLTASASLPSALLARADGPSPPPGASNWDEAIARFEAADKARPPSPGGIVFVGSSSIRKWTTLERDMAPLAVINRGFGGSHIPHCTWFAPRIVLPHQPSAVVLYAGDNDVAWGAKAEKVLADFEAFLAAIRVSDPDLPLYFLAIKPSPLRWKHWPEMQRANALIQEKIRGLEAVHYIDVASPLLHPNGSANNAFFAKDRLHLSESGYVLWTAIVRDGLRAHMPPASP